MDDIALLIERNNPVPFESRLALNQSLTFEACLAYCRARQVIFDPKTNTNFGFWDPQRAGWTNLAELCSDQGTAQFVLNHYLDEDKTKFLTPKKFPEASLPYWIRLSNLLREPITPVWKNRRTAPWSELIITGSIRTPFAKLLSINWSIATTADVSRTSSTLRPAESIFGRPADRTIFCPKRFLRTLPQVAAT